MGHLTTQTEWEEMMCERILNLVHDELYFDYRYFDVALSSFTFCKREEIQSIATDGISFYYPLAMILRVYKKNPVFLNRAYLHLVLHCVFRQLWLRKNKNPVIWNLASDIAVEWILDHSQAKSTRRILSRIRTNYYEHLKKEKIPVTAAAIYHDLLKITDFEEQKNLQMEFYVDDHRYWPGDEKKSPGAEQAGRKWDKIGRRVEKEMERRGSENCEGTDKIVTQIHQGKSRRSYRDFLKKFMVLKEEMVCDDDEFDLNYYTYGLRLYHNMPLIEPLESREIMKILNFVIVIDTSYSTNGDLVKRFLEETFQIITSRDSFFRKSKIHLIQCDNRVHTDALIENTGDIDRLLNDFELNGGGGTDFRPAFSYINEQIKEGNYEHLKGVLYFTDGKGIYPAKRPPFDTAFVFMENEDLAEVPAWAMKVILDPDELLQYTGDRK